MKTIAVVDIGTNSIRLAVVHIESNHFFNTLAAQKEVIRLGEGEFAHNKLTNAAMERCLLVLKQFGQIARSYGATEMVATATAAVREAANRAEFLERAKSEAGVEVRVISGLEEARLIYLGIASGEEMGNNRGLFVDIGGGTTELVLGDAKDYSFLDSLKLGAIRLSDMFLKHETGCISKKKYNTMLDYVRGVGSNAFRKINDQGFDMAYGSSGTIMNLAEITARRVGAYSGSIRGYRLRYSDLSETISTLCSLTLEERRSVPGINPERADIILSGAAILDAVMSGTNAESIKISDRALRDGLIVDHLFEEDEQKAAYLAGSSKARSIMNLCQSCHFEESHARQIAALSNSLYKQVCQAKMHAFSEYEEELLHYAAMVHDIGTFISYIDHHKHTYYLVRNWGLLGFDEQEIEIISTIAMCHRKMAPKKSAGDNFKTVSALTAILRVADALDRSQRNLVSEVILRRMPQGDTMAMEIYSSENCPLELWALENKKRLFEQVFGVDLSVRLMASR